MYYYDRNNDSSFLNQPEYSHIPWPPFVQRPSQNGWVQRLLCSVLWPSCSLLRSDQDEVVWSEDLTKWTRTDRVHSAWLEVETNRSWDVLSSCSLIVVDVDTLEMEIRVTVISTGRVDVVFIRDHLPELNNHCQEEWLKNPASSNWDHIFKWIQVRFYKLVIIKFVT